jgi:hypothetical protein
MIDVDPGEALPCTWVSTAKRPVFTAAPLAPGEPAEYQRGFLTPSVTTPSRIARGQRWGPRARAGSLPERVIKCGLASSDALEEVAPGEHVVAVRCHRSGRPERGCLFGASRRALCWPCQTRSKRDPSTDSRLAGMGRRATLSAVATRRDSGRRKRHGTTVNQMFQNGKQSAGRAGLR